MPAFYQRIADRRYRLFEAIKVEDDATYGLCHLVEVVEENRQVAVASNLGFPWHDRHDKLRSVSYIQSYLN